MTDADLILSRTIEELIAGYQSSKDKGKDPLAYAIKLLDDRIQEQQHYVQIPLWVEICQKHRLSETEWAPILADIFRTIATRCQVWEVNEWMDAEADLAEFQHE